MQHSLQFSGEAQITLRAFTDCVINKKNYVENEPVATFNAVADVAFRDDSARAMAANTAVQHFVSIPEFVLIYNIIGSTELYNLIGIDTKEDYGSLPTEEEQVSSSSGYIYLNKNIDIEKEYFIYNEDGEIQSGITFNETHNRFENADSDTNYLINYYYIREELAAYSLGNTNLPLLKIELLFRGNIDKQSGYMLITVPKCRLTQTPDLSITFQTTNSQQLLFAIMSDKKRDSSLLPTVKFYY